MPATATATATATAIAIDWTRCDGHGLCRELLPHRVELDEWGFPILRDARIDAADENELADARRAVAACPALALHLTRT